MPCRAQGRPTPRIIWDRIGVSTTSQLHQHPNGGKIPSYTDKDTQEDRLTKAKIMSLRSKRSFFETVHMYNNTVEHSYNNKLSRNEYIVNTSGQTVQIAMNEEKLQLKRTKRQEESKDEKSDNIINDGDNRSVDTIPIVVFSTQEPPEVSRLQVTDNGELILIDVTERDQVIVVKLFNF